MGDLNAKIGRRKIADVVEEYGIGDRDDRCDRLIEFCQLHEMVSTNNYFKLPLRRYLVITSTLKVPTVTSVKTYPGTDINSDHNTVLAKIQQNWQFRRN